MSVVVDKQARYLRRVRRLRRAARRWSVNAGVIGGAAIVLVPYQGLAVVDAVWMAAAGGSAALAAWRWIDLRVALAEPPPPAPDPAVSAERGRRRLESFVAALPGGREALSELRRQRDRVRVRGTAVASGWRRLDQASSAFEGLSPRLGGPAEPAALDALAAERALRELAERIASVEKGMGFATGDTHEALAQAHAALVAQFEQGVAAYEGLVGAAAAYLAEDGQTVEDPSVSRLTDAADLLRGVAAGLAELRSPGPPPPAPAG
jgi:hypothetical protein